MQLNKKTYKDAARRLSQFTQGIQVPYGKEPSKALSYNQSLEALARALFNRGWGEAKEMLEDKPAVSTPANIPPVVLVDEDDIPASFSGMTLFLWGKPVFSIDETNDAPISDLADNLAEALHTQALRLNISHQTLAEYCAKQQGEAKPTEDEYDEFCQGYTSEDVWGAIASQFGWSSSSGNTTQIQNCNYVEASTLVPRKPEWQDFWLIISTNAPFSWGDNNSTLVTASDFLRHVENALDISEPDWAEGEDEFVQGAFEDPVSYWDYNALCAKLRSLGETYIDLEN